MHAILRFITAYTVGQSPLFFPCGSGDIAYHIGGLHGEHLVVKLECFLVAAGRALQRHSFECVHAARLREPVRETDKAVCGEVIIAGFESCNHGLLVYVPCLGSAPNLSVLNQRFGERKHFVCVSVLGIGPERSETFKSSGGHNNWWCCRRMA